MGGGGGGGGGRADMGWPNLRVPTQLGKSGDMLPQDIFVICML